MLRQHQDEGNFAELRRLEPEKAQVKPALGSLHRHSEHHDPEKKDKGKSIDTVSPGEKPGIPDLEHPEIGDSGEAAPQELPGRKSAPSAVKTGARAENGRHAEKEEGQDRKKLEPIQAGQVFS
ncbi:hypothetical protein SDC9_55353 [bioreactor metagenome]|uniref:Uncharacterized protein n=1 Tax=bioreactor metagenome TaxID=1076179 RepID=A0A644WZ95_9ZZZZ